MKIPLYQSHTSTLTWFDTILGDWNLCGPNNCMDMRPLPLSEGGRCLFSDTFFCTNASDTWATYRSISVTQASNVTWGPTLYVSAPPIFFLLISITVSSSDLIVPTVCHLADLLVWLHLGARVHSHLGIYCQCHPLLFYHHHGTGPITTSESNQA